MRAFVEERIAREQVSASRVRTGRRTAKGAPSSRHKKLCYFPGCKNIAAPRFGMFCVALHKDLPKRQKNEIQAQRQ